MSVPGDLFLAVLSGSLELRFTALGNGNASLALESEAGLTGKRGYIPSQGQQKGRGEG